MKIKRFISILMVCFLVLPSLLTNAYATDNTSWYDTRVGQTLASISSENYNSSNPFSKGQCTWYCFGRALEKCGVYLPAWKSNGTYGNADEWYYNAASAGFSVGYEVRSNSIACYSGMHVIFVEWVDGETVYYTEANKDSNGTYNSGVDCVLVESTITKLRQRLNSTYQGCIYLDGSGLPTHTVDSSYGTNFTAYPKAKITAENIRDANHNQISKSAWIGTSDLCTIHEVYTDGCCKVTYPLSNGSTKTVYSKISLFNVSIPRSPASLGDSFTAPILNKEHWKIIENNNGVIQTANETGTSNQLWKFERQSDGSYKISSCSDGRCLDVTESSNASGTKVCAWEDNGGDNQRWFIYEEAGGYVLKAKCTDCVLDLPNNDPTNGNQLHMYTKNGTGAQVWAIYRGDECKLTAPTLSVSVGKSSTKTTFTWNNVYGETGYDVKIWKGTIWEGDAYHVEWDTFSGWGIQLPQGTYQAYVDVSNYYETIMSNVVTFTVQAGTYTVSYNANGGTGTPSSQTKTHGVNLTLSSSKPTRNGYTFLGWATSSTATNATYQPGGNFTTNANTTLYAVWKQGCEAGAHSYSFKVTKAPTTSATGILTQSCSKCTSTATITLPKLNTTDYTYKVTKEATCTAAGTGRYTWKTTTYGSFYFDVAISAKGHSYTNKVTAPTCTAQGYTTHTCSCGYSYKDTYTNATGHSYSYKVTKSPTTSATGTLTGTCSKCKGTTTVTLPKLSTTDYSYTVKTAATCTATGTGRYTWKTTTYGSFYFDVTIAAKGHSYTNKVTAPTCTAQGYTTHTCSCGYSYKDTYTNATGHSYSYKVTKTPTTSATGTLTGTCSKCKGTTSVTLPKLNTTDYSYAVKTAATCTAAGTGRYTWKTTTYGSFYFDVAIAAKGHSYTNKVTAPTCTAQGYTTHTCSCGYSYKDTYTNATGHSYSYKVTKSPTTSATGTLTGTCSKCKGTTTVTLPKLNTTDYSYAVKTAPTYTSAGVGRYTWKTTAYGSFSFDVTLDKLDAAGQIVVQSGSAAPGETVTVTIALKNNPGIASLKLRVSYDDMLTLTDISYNTAIGGQFQQPQSMTNPVTLNWFNGAADVTGDWVFATLTFEVSANAQPQDVAIISASYDPEDVYNIAETNIAFDVVAGEIKIADYIPGDINNDGVVNNKDLTRLFQYLSDWNVAVNEPALDVNGDGNVNNKDLTRLFQYLSDWNVEIH